MALNFCQSKLGTKILCNTVSFEGHDIENLIADVWPNRGFIAGSFIRPPIDILVQFPCPVSMCCLVIDAQVGSQQSLGCEILVQSESPSNYDPFNHGLFRLIGKYFWDPDKRGLHLSSARHTLQCKSEERPHYLRQNLSERISTELLHDVRTLRLRVSKTLGSSVPCLQSLKVFGYVSYSCQTDLARSVLQKWFASFDWQHNQKVEIEEPKQDTADELSFPDGFVVPDEFLDGLTCEIMAIPVRLPSGNVIDERTYERFIQQEAAWGRPASDPFTGQLFDSHRKPLYDTALKARIDAFLVQNSDRKCLQSVGRTAGPITKRSSETLLPGSNTHFPNAAHCHQIGPKAASRDQRPTAPLLSTSGSSQSTDQSRRWLANLATAQRYVSRERSSATALPTSTSKIASCWCSATHGLYLLPCAHHVCRSCLLISKESKDMQCQHCRRPFSSQQPVRLHCPPTGS